MFALDNKILNQVTFIVKKDGRNNQSIYNTCLKRYHFKDKTKIKKSF